MNRKGEVTQYFPGGNTAQGFYSLWNSNIDDLDKLIILKGGPGTGKSNLMLKLSGVLVEKGFDVELLWCSSDAESLDGVVLRGISLGIVDGTAPHLRDPIYPGVVDKIINLGDYWDEKVLQKNKAEIFRLTDLNKALFRETFRLFALAKKDHDVLEKLYIEGMDWKAVDTLTADLVEKLFSSYPKREGGRERHRFAGASTPQGSVNYLDDLISKARTRYIIKGRAGTGKSTLTKRVAREARLCGFAVEYYHCSFDPDSIDNIYIPELSLCIIDGTPPHEKTPQPGDNVLDMFSYMSGAVYQQNEEKIAAFDKSYQRNFNKALEVLKECKGVHDELEKCYIEAMDFEALNKVREKLISEILEYARA